SVSPNWFANPRSGRDAAGNASHSSRWSAFTIVCAVPKSTLSSVTSPAIATPSASIAIQTLAARSAVEDGFAGPATWSAAPRIREGRRGPFADVAVDREVGGEPLDKGDRRPHRAARQEERRRQARIAKGAPHSGGSVPILPRQRRGAPLARAPGRPPHIGRSRQPIHAPPPQHPPPLPPPLPGPTPSFPFAG